MGKALCPEVSNTNADLREVQHLTIARKEETLTAKPYKRPENAATKDDFTMKKVIGVGTYGKVYLVQHKTSGVHYAMKVIKKELVFRTCTDEGIKGKSSIRSFVFSLKFYLLAERDILTRFDHPFIMQLEWSFQDKNNLYMVMEFVNGGELFHHLHQNNQDGFDEERAKFYGAQIVLALEHMHNEGVIYRDLKPENILIDSEGYLRITDFGLSKVIKEE